ncbi:efflux RND transporter periplasmic adaptor subunit [Caenimonas terrae]|uniref:Efflux RND transporter periplasmic adaptor subunit n=1 Tax=Caenimonas terrae TaxID=696074 RepID=A0ABW0NJ90_9BURK
MKSFRRLLLLALLAPGTASMAAQPLGCLIEPFRVSDIGSPVIGVIEATLVERGDIVRAGQPMATLRADVERQSVAVAASKAQAIGELRGAEATLELARQKLGRARELADQQFISGQALEQARADFEVAEHRLGQAREQRAVFAREQDLAQAQLGLRTIRSPIAGVVAERFLSAGERVEEKAMFRVAMVNPLRVEVVLPSTYFSAVRSGMTVTVTPDFPGASPRLARVTVVDRLIDGASNTFRIRAELPNADYSLPAGLRCKADLGDSSPLPAGKPPARPGSSGTDTSMRLQLAPALVSLTRKP